MLEDGKPSMRELLHYGVQGMKWGVRKAKSTSSEIRDARIRQAARYRRFAAAEDELNLASETNNQARIKRAVRKYEKTAIDFDTNEDRVTARRLTKGEKWVQVFLGPAALISLPLNKLGEKAVERDVDRKRKQLAGG